MTQSQETLSWLELILIMSVITITVFIVIYLFTGLVPFQIPEFIFNEQIFDGFKSDMRNFEKVVPPKNLVILGLSVFSGAAFMKSFK